MARIAELERMVGRLTMENELLKKAVEYTAQRRKSFPHDHAKSLAVSKGMRSDGAGAQHFYPVEAEALRAKKEKWTLGIDRKIVVKCAGMDSQGDLHSGVRGTNQSQAGAD